MSGSSHSIVQLLTQARSGDDGAKEALFTRCRSYVNIVARTQVEGWMRAKVDASDLVQQTMLEVHRGFQDFRGESEGEWLAWLRRILTNNTTDFVRRYRQTAKRQASREVPLEAMNRQAGEEFRLDPQGECDTPSEIVMRRETEIEVAHAISQLAEDHQEVIILRNLQRLPFDEVAARMGRSRPAAQMLWTRAIRRLQETLKTSRND